MLWPMLKHLFALSLVCLLMVGCGDTGSLEVVSERDEKHFNRGQLKLSQQRYDEALGAFLKVIEKRREAPESHLEAGRLYQDYLGDPVAAIYHYRMYLEYQPASDEAPMVKQMVEEAKKDFARQLPGRPYDDDIDRLDLLEIIETVREENLELKRQLASATQRVAQLEGAEIRPPSFSGSTNAGQTNTRTPGQNTRPSSQSTTYRPPSTTSRPSTNTAPVAASSGRTYTVKSGDTLSRISTEVYGNSARWQDIFNANRDVLPNPNALRVGQVLKIPAE